MTPLAHRFAKELTLLRKDRTIDDRAGILARLDRVHSFDCSAIVDPVADAMDDALEHNDLSLWQTITRLLPDTFLPAEVTWLELGTSAGYRRPRVNNLALVLEKQSDDWLKLDLAFDSFSVPLGHVRKGHVFDLHHIQWEPSDMARNAEGGAGDHLRQAMGTHLGLAVLLLDIINQPTLCRLKTHQPHRGLERALRRNAVGRYPLLAWHEVLIKPQDRPLTREEEEGHLTGRKCLHFVRSHWRRFWDGRETLVTHHWRGDPALGIAQTRYRVEGAKRRTK